jgi:hypothetical protein
LVVRPSPQGRGRPYRSCCNCVAVWVKSHTIVVDSFAAIIEVRALLGRGGNLSEAMVEPSLTCATVDEVAACGIHGGAGSRG